MRKRSEIYAEFVALGMSVEATGKPPETYREAIALALYKKTQVDPIQVKRKKR